MLSAARYFLVCCLLFATHFASAQKEANIWYFGNYLGLDFNSGSAIALNDGQLTTTEGVATICNKNGALLFYTEGTKIWNRFHQLMPNGSGLLGSFTSTQSAVIVPFIGDTSRYYVFTVDAQGGPLGLTYSVVNMTLDNGRGDVEQKNLALITNVTEKITAVKHCNNRDIWVLGHKTASDTYFAFLVTAAGVNTTPVLSNTGTVLVPPPVTDSTTLGYLKASFDGKKIAAAHWNMNVDVSDFNNATGVVSSSYSLFVPGDPHYLAYGVEFSPNNKLVYTTVFFTDPITRLKRNALYQYDVSLATPAAVRASRQVISQNSDPIQSYAALQVGPDGKMYMAKHTYKNIAAINDPNVYGPGCNFVASAINYTLGPQSSTFGLPTFIQSYFFPVDSFKYTINCPGSTVNFSYTLPGGTNSVLWNFGDPASGTNNTSTLNNPVHFYRTAGTYTVQLIKFTNCGTDTIRRTIVTDVLNLDLGPDTLVCGGINVLLNPTAAGSANNFLWQDGSTNPTYLATTSGLYWVEVRNAMGCVSRDTINVNFKPSPVFELGNNTDICEGTSITLNANAANAESYLWNTGATSPTLQVTQAALYWCQTNKGGCIFRDSITIGVKPIPVVDLGKDTTVCEGVSLTYDATYLNSTYLWQNGSTNAIQAITQPGTYIVQVNYNGCKRSDTVEISHTPKPRFSLGADQLICPGKTIVLKPATNSSWQLSWQDGSTNQSFAITEPGTYRLTATNNCGSSTDEMIVKMGYCKVIVPNAFSPNNDRNNEQFKVLGVERVTSFHMRIFNRWGQIVFETTDKNKGWDGKVNGQDVSTGTFVYILLYTDTDNPAQQMLKGSLLLIR